MKRKETHQIVAFCYGIFLALCMTYCTVSANSSWYWISEKRPYDILPWVVLGTLLVEITAVRVIAGCKPLWKTMLVIVFGNAVSFLFPWIFLMKVPIVGGMTWQEYVEYAPVYTVGVGFLFLTLVIELPLGYFLLRKNTTHRIRLLFVLIGSNLVTTVGTAAVERMICYGAW